MVILDKLKKLVFIINIFFIYSFLGFLFENALSLISGNGFNSGVLYGPWTFIYGIAIFFIMFLNRFLKRFNIPKWLEVVIFYIVTCIIMTLIEFTGGMLIEKIFHVVYWDYTNMKFNYGHYICLEVSLFWGLFATLVNYKLTPLIENFEKKIPLYVTIILVILFIIDIIVTSLK